MKASTCPPIRPSAWLGPAIFALGALFLMALGPVAARANPLIQQAREAGVLDVETALLYRVYDLLDPERLPEQYRTEPLLEFCGTPLLVEANDHRSGMSPENQRLLAKVLARPALETSMVTPSGRFRVHYSVTGGDGVDPEDGDGNGIPDYVDTVAAVLDRVWDLEVETLGYAPPPSDGSAGGGPEIDVYILDLGRLHRYGLTFPDSGGLVTSSYLQIDNNYTDDIFGQASLCEGARGTRGLDALHVTVAHEFFHMIQFGYYRGSDGAWWQEASATWMEDVAYPDADDYLQYVCAFLGVPHRSVDSGRPASYDEHPYGASVFAHFLDQRYDRDVIRSVWEEFGRRRSGSIAHFDRVLLKVDDEGLDGAMSDFAMWNYFTGTRHREEFYSEGEKYSEPLVLPTHVIPGATVRDSGHVDHLASAYMLLLPQLRRGGVTVETELARGTWRRQLALLTPDSMEVRRLDPVGPIRVPDWDAYREVVLVLTNTDEIGIGFDYAISVDYDPGFREAASPLALGLGDAYPNPFTPTTHPHTILPYQLSASSAVTRLTLFDAGGQLVRRYDLGSRAPRAYSHSWDGTNQEGQLVGSGIYYYVLEADQGTVRKTLALVRD